MINRETPSVDELREMFEHDGGNASSVDILVHIALGLYDENYIDMARTIASWGGGIKELAHAEARLETIELFDERPADDETCQIDGERSAERLAGIGAIVESMSETERDLYFDEFDAESDRLEGVQFALKHGLADLLDNKDE